MSLPSQSPRTPRTTVGLRVLSVLAVAVLAAALPAAVAQADSIVYLKGGNVWIAQPDGSNPRPFTPNANNWSSPSEADDGTVVAAGGQARVNPGGTDSSGSSELYRFSGDGTQLGGPIPTWGSNSSPACPTYGPASVRVSPDATKIAYGIWTCGDPGYTTLWTPATATGLSFPNQTLGQKDWYEPAWIDSARFTVTHVGTSLAGAGRWFVHPVAGGDYANEGAWDPDPGMTGSGLQGVIARTGDKFVIFEDDAASWSDGKPRNVKLWLQTSPDGTLAGAEAGGWTDRCGGIPLDAASTQNPFRLSPSISPDGTKVMWGDDRGVEMASIANPANCASIVPQLLIPGGSQPFYAKGDEQPAKRVVPPCTSPNPACTPPKCRPTCPSKPLRAAFSVTPKRPRARHRVVFDARRSSGAITSYAWKFGDRRTGKGRRATHRYGKRKTYTVSLTVRDRAGRRATVTHRVKVRR